MKANKENGLLLVLLILYYNKVPSALHLRVQQAEFSIGKNLTYNSNIDKYLYSRMV